MKNFSKFIKEEITIKGNSGIPGESNDNKDNEKKYLSDVERRARQRLGVPREENPMLGRPNQTISTYNELNILIEKSMKLIKGKEKKLEDLAKKIILSEYGSILENVELDIKIVTSLDIKKFMDDEDEGEEEMPSYRLLNDPEIKKEVDKRKILNNIIQGEAKNTKRILAMPEVRYELIKIYGEVEGKEAQKIWMRITELADKLDWLIPINIKSDMMERAPQGLSGACSVKWPDKKSDKDPEDSLDKVLKHLEDGDIDDNDKDLKDLLSNGNPIIKARGVDFPMLIHETVKGIYELIASAGIPEDKKTAELVILNTSSFSDEAEEFRFGPEIAADIRDFINKTKKNIDNYTNVREKFCGKLAVMPAEEFLHLVKNILSESPYARTKVDEIIQNIMDEEDEYRRKLAEYEASSKLDYFDQDEEDDVDDFEQSQEEDERVVKKPYEQMTQAEIQQEIENAIAEENYELAGELTKKFLKKEAKIIWEKELKRINDSRRYSF
jgi:hypothetical protein